MLISFSVGNFKSIRDLQTLSMEAQSDERFEHRNVFRAEKHRLLKSAAIYGPNASGKSNVIEAMIWFRQFVLNSSKESQAEEPISVNPFRLSTVTEHAPSHFEAEFLIEGVEFRYGFTVTSTQVTSEWLYRKSPGKKTVKLFSREADSEKSELFDVSTKHFKEGKGLEVRTRKNALFLSVCAQFNVKVAESILRWMSRFRHVSGLSETGFFAFTAERLLDQRHQQSLLELAKTADLNITSLGTEVKELDPGSAPSKVPPEVWRKLFEEHTRRIKTGHPKRNEEGEIVEILEFDLKADESQGTQKFIALSGPITHTLEEGSILVVDELEARLHPLLTQAIVDLFHSPVNRKNAQLLFATHDVTLMEPDRFRRDQIWFCEKDEAGATDLYCLADLDANQVRPTTKFSRQYLQGLFGAVPKLAHFEEAAADATKN
jgi:predicted ATP-dependent endonuclease of OLD family